MNNEDATLKFTGLKISIECESFEISGLNSNEIKDINRKIELAIKMANDLQIKLDNIENARKNGA